MRLLTAMGLTLVATLGCGGASKRSADLVLDVRGYGDGLRWRDFPSAAIRVAPAERSDFLDQHEDLDKDLRIADWEMTRMTYDASRNHAVVQVEWTWLLDSRGIVHTTVTRQMWTRHGKQWLLDREVHVRGDDMPGVAPRENRDKEAAAGGEAGARRLRSGPDARAAKKY